MGTGAPALPGRYSQVESVDDAMETVTEAVELHLEALRDEDAGILLDSDAVFQVRVPVGW